MPRLDYAFVKKDLKTETLTSTIENIDDSFQLALERELVSTRNKNGVLDTALFGETLTALHRTLTDICHTHRSVNFQNIPRHITALIQEMINSNPTPTAGLRFVYFIKEHSRKLIVEKWEPKFIDPRNIETLKQELSSTLRALKVSKVALLEHTRDYRQLHDNTHSPIEKLLAQRAIHQLNKSSLSRANIPYIQKEREAEIENLDVALKAILQDRIDQYDEITIHKKLVSKLRKKRDTLKKDIDAILSCSSAFFKEKAPAATETVEPSVKIEPKKP